MPEKAKRKVNPRRRTLMRLIVGIGILIALIAGAIQVLRPKGAQIVYIAHDEDGRDQVWLMNLNNPERPRQLTEFESGFIWNFQVESNTILIIVRQDLVIYDLWVYELNHHELHHVIHCVGDSDIETNCGNWQLSRNGNHVAYTRVEGLEIPELMVYDVTAREHNVLRIADNRYGMAGLHWVDEGQTIHYTSTDLVNNVTNMQSLQLNGTEQLIGAWIWFAYQTPQFSPNGEYYVYSRVRNLGSNNRPHLNYHIYELGGQEQEISIPFSGQLNDDIEQVSDLLSWHPSSQKILFSEQFYTNNYQELLATRVILYDSQTQQYEELSLSETISGEGVIFADFNADGSQLIMSHQIENEFVPQIVFYDVLSMNEVQLPLFGYNPQWVNGGR